MAKNRADVQLVWGVALVLMGIGVFFRIPQVMPRVIKEYEYFASASGYAYFCVYLLGILLIAGGSKKIYEHYQKTEDNGSEG